MDELCLWFEVIRGLLPERYTVRLIAECEAIVAGEPFTGHLAYVTLEEVRGRTVTEVMDDLRRQLGGGVDTRIDRVAC